MESHEMSVARSDLEKVYDTLSKARAFHERRDEMNAAVHMAEQVRYSPLTSNLAAEHERVARLLGV